MSRSGHAEHHLFADGLDGAGDVHLSLRQFGLWHPRRPAEQVVEGPVGHREACEVVEVLLVQDERPILAQVHQLREDHLHVLGLAVRRETHHLVFTGVDLESGVVRESGIQEPERVGPADLL